MPSLFEGAPDVRERGLAGHRVGRRQFDEHVVRPRGDDVGGGETRRAATPGPAFFVQDRNRVQAVGVDPGGRRVRDSGQHEAQLGLRREHLEETPADGPEPEHGDPHASVPPSGSTIKRPFSAATCRRRSSARSISARVVALIVISAVDGSAIAGI